MLDCFPCSPIIWLALVNVIGGQYYLQVNTLLTRVLLLGLIWCCQIISQLSNCSTGFQSRSRPESGNFVGAGAIVWAGSGSGTLPIQINFKLSHRLYKLYVTLFTWIAEKMPGHSGQSCLFRNFCKDISILVFSNPLFVRKFFGKFCYLSTACCSAKNKTKILEKNIKLKLHIFCVGKKIQTFSISVLRKLWI